MGRGLAFSFLMALILAVSARINFMTPLSPVPVTFQTGAVLISGLLLGPRWGTWSVILYLSLGFLGAPVFAMGLGGPGIILQPSFGYLLAFILAAFVTGTIASRGARTFANGVIAAFSGMAIIWVVGSIWLAGFFMVSGMGVGLSVKSAFAGGIMPFIAVDLLKAILATGLWTAWRNIRLD
jgi:biotin transport system substrate-specific component